MAQLLSWLAIAGARTSAGAAVASGAAWFYQPGGGTTAATVYTDVNATVIASNPVTLDSGGRATVYVASPVRIVVQDSTGATVSDLDQADVARAEAVQLVNAGWSDSYLDSVLTKLYTSTGGVDGQYQESSGATARTIKSKFAELTISVKDFGAKGDGVTVDTTAIQAACNRCSALGGGEVYFPPGTYKIDLAITVASKVSLRGASRVAVTINSTSSTANAITISSSGGFAVSGMYISNTGTSTGAGIALSACNSYTIRDVSIDSFKYGVDVTGATSFAGLVLNCLLDGTFGDNTFRGIHYNTTGGVSGPHAIIGCYINGGTGAGAELTGSTSSVKFVGNHFLTGSTTGILFNAALTGIAFYASGNSFQGATTAYDLSGLSTDPYFYQECNGVDGYTTNVLTGGTVTPNRGHGSEIRIRGTTTGSAYIIAAPSPAPLSIMRGVYLTLSFYNNAGGPITGWTMNAAYHLSAGPSLTDGDITTYRLVWDADASVWRQISRQITT